jgi:predicted nuclease of predicted toxin-antitoxin system
VKLFAALYVDENMHVLVPTYLRSRGFDAIHARDAEMKGACDREQFRFAIEQERVIVTHDRLDFLALHEEWITDNLHHFGIILTGVRPPAEIARRVATLVNRLTADEIVNGLFYV